MGRRRKIRVGFDRRIRADYQKQIKQVKTADQLVSFLNEGSGPVQETLFELEIVGFARSGNYEVRPDKVEKAIKDLRKAIVDTREIPREETERIAGEIGQARNLSAKQIINASDREYRLQAQSIRLVAESVGLELSVADKRTLTQAETSCTAPLRLDRMLNAVS